MVQFTLRVASFSSTDACYTLLHVSNSDEFVYDAKFGFGFTRDGMFCIAGRDVTIIELKPSNISII